MIKALIIIGYILLILNYILTKMIRNNYERLLRMCEKMCDKRDEIIRTYQKEQVTLLENAREYRARITDLENNVEFLTNNLTPQKKKLVRPENQN